ncbi:MAG TPA: GFA family protein [Rhizomicrobium sp.]|nr:GFA family protein [Rhizomicrobium sp.]
MSELVTGGCLCGAVRYVAQGEPRFAGYCFCDDCRRQSGSGYIGFMGYDPGAIRITGAVLVHSHKLSDGRVADRNHCAVCWSLVFGGIIGEADNHTIYAGSLDDPSRFKPTIAINARERAPWVVVPEGVTVFDRMPRG